MSDQVIIALIWASVVTGMAGGVLWFVYKNRIGDFSRWNDEREVKWKIRMVKMQHEAERQLERKP